MRSRLAPILALAVAAFAAPAAASAPEVRDTGSPTELAETRQERVLVVRPGDTLLGLLGGAGAIPADAHAAIAMLATLFRPSALRPGDEVAIRISTAEPPALMEVEIEPEPGRTIRARRLQGGNWSAEQTVSPRTRFIVRADGTVDGGLFSAMARAGIPAGLGLSMIGVLGHQVDFQRDLHPGDRFSFLFERFRDSDGDILGHGQMLHATLFLSGRTLTAWGHKDRHGATQWYDSAGRNLKRSFLRTPLDGARMTSRFGMRSHPILGFNRMHRGIDFAAPTGTPVYAAADGTIVSAKRDRGYGLLVRIRHAGGVETRYAHLSRFSRGITPGRRVRQGHVIGAVGSTGLSTGPHLHYEIVANGRHVNPARHVMPTTRLSGAELRTFRAAQRSLTRIASTLATLHEIAMAPD